MTDYTQLFTFCINYIHALSVQHTSRPLSNMILHNNAAISHNTAAYFVDATQVKAGQIINSQ